MDSGQTALGCFRYAPVCLLYDVSQRLLMQPDPATGHVAPRMFDWLQMGCFQRQFLIIFLFFPFFLQKILTSPMWPIQNSNLIN